MENKIKFNVMYNDKDYTFDYGSEVFIFHTGIYNDMDKKYGIEVLLDYVNLVHDCYLSDNKMTSLGAFADFVADKWEKVKHLGRYSLLNKFYKKLEADYEKH